MNSTDLPKKVKVVLTRAIRFRNNEYESVVELKPGTVLELKNTQANELIYSKKAVAYEGTAKHLESDAKFSKEEKPKEKPGKLGERKATEK